MNRSNKRGGGRQSRTMGQETNEIKFILAS